MKAQILCLVVLMMANLASTCRDKNPILTQLGQSGLSLFDAPMADTRTCNFEWASYNTCCPADAFKLFLGNKKQETLAAAQATYDNLIRVLDDIALYSSPASAINLTQQNSVLKYGQLKMPTNYSQLMYWFGLLNTSRNTFLSNALTCANAVNQKRETSLCVVCSGRSEQFFQDGKLKCTDSFCDSYLSQCHQSLLQMSWFSSMNKQYKVILEEMKQTVVGFAPTVNPQVLDFGVTWFEQNNTHAAVAACRDGLNSASCTNAHKATLCGYALVAMNLPTINVIGTKSVDSKNAIVTTTHPTDTRLLSMISFSGERRLNAPPPEEFTVQTNPPPSTNGDGQA